MPSSGAKLQRGLDSAKEVVRCHVALYTLFEDAAEGVESPLGAQHGRDVELADCGLEFVHALAEQAFAL